MIENKKLDHDRYRGILKCMAGKYIKNLSEHGLYGKLEFFREYMVKISVKDSKECHGYILIYYKPTEKRFKVCLDEILEEAPRLTYQSLWNKTYSKQESSKKKRVKIDWFSSTPN